MVDFCQFIDFVHSIIPLICQVFYYVPAVTKSQLVEQLNCIHGLNNHQKYTSNLLTSVFVNTNARRKNYSIRNHKYTSSIFRALAEYARMRSNIKQNT